MLLSIGPHFFYQNPSLLNHFCHVLSDPMHGIHLFNPRSFSPILCAFLLVLISACSSGKSVKTTDVQQTKTDGQNQTDAAAAKKDQERIAGLNQEVKDLTQKLKDATDANADLDDAFTHGIRAELPVLTDNDLKDDKEDGLPFFGFYPINETEKQSTKSVQIKESNLRNESVVLTMNSVGIVEDNLESALEYVFGLFGEISDKSKLMLGFRRVGTKLAGHTIDYTFPEKIQFLAIDPQKKKRTSVFAGAVTGKMVFHPEVADEPSYVTVTAKILTPETASGPALAAVETQAKQAPSGSVVELIDDAQINNNSGIYIGDEVDALVVLKLNGYKLIGTYTLDEGLEGFEKRTDKFEVVEDIELLKSQMREK